MKDKAFFQLVALVALVVMVVFLFYDAGSRLNLRVLVSGGLFVGASVMSLLTGRPGTGRGDE